MRRNSRHIKMKFGAMLLGALCALSIVALPEVGLAQADQLAAIQDTTGLGSASPALIAARLIRTVLGFLGVVAVLVTLWGGFTWMTAGGNAEKVDRAKKILISGAIGTAIIIASFAITVFVINSLLNATGVGGGGTSTSDGGGGGLGGGSGSPTAGFVVTSISPDEAVPIRNVVVQVVTNRRIDAESVASAVTVREVGGADVPGTIEIRNNRISFRPEAACPEPNEDYKCFGENTQYQVEVNSSLKDTSGRDLDCSLDRCLATFETGSLVDTEDPVASYEFPTTGSVLAPFSDIITRASATDDAGVALIEFSAGDVVYDAVPVTELLQSATLETLWNNSAYEPGSRYGLEARAIDIAGNEDTASVSVRIGPAHCYDGEQNENETGLDCGGDCGACGGEQCTEDSECSSGSCVNGLCENVSNEGAASKPIIYEISPSVGAIGEVITITGASFGSLTGKVEFKNTETGDTAVGSLEFPQQCGTDFWDPTEVLIRVPETYLSSEGDPQPIEITTHELRLITKNGRASDPIPFVIRTGEPGPGICALINDTEEIGDEIQIVGLNFGSAAGSVIFHDAISIQATNAQWGVSAIEMTVPEGTTTGQLTVETPSGDESNPVLLKIGQEEAAGAGTTLGASAYAWSFSTGRVPEKPKLIVECSAERVSSVPNNQFTNGTVCVNAKVYAEFTTLIDHTSLIYGNTVRVDECLNQNCSQTALVAGEFVASNQGDELSTSANTSISFVPDYGYNNGRFKADTRYEVTVTGNIRSNEGAVLDAPASYSFTTRDNPEDCAVQNVRIAPRKKTFTAENETSEFLALAMAGECQPLNGDFDWSWGVTESIAEIDVARCEEVLGNDCAVVTAMSEGVGEVTVEETLARLGAEADIEVNFADPYVTANHPSNACLEACTDAHLGAEFNISMDPASFAGNVTIQECRNELCGNFVGPNLFLSAVCEATDETCKELKFTINNNLKVDTYYRITVGSGVSSPSGVGLTRPNYGQDFSWTFKVREENAQCRLARFDVRPDESILRDMGDTQSYSVAAFGSPDSCSVAGQRLNTEQFNWNWETPIVDDEGVAKWVTARGQDGLLSNATSIPLGCTESCLPMGSSSIAATCGDGIVSRGEECEDGNTENGDGCSAQCLREGGDIVGECGNGVLERLSTSAGEDCDDGNLVDGDGCSALCLNEGAPSAGVCGDGRLNVSVISGGEDCDDGNLVNGDGCSAQCQNEGAGVSVAGQPVCGDGVITSPYESCDDGNTVGGDGCSARCIQDGRYIVAVNPDGSPQYSVCGNGTIENNPITGAGEACDDKNTANGDGCSSTCRLEGSSLDYAEPSFCGDGLEGNDPLRAGAGEYALCEVGVTAASTSSRQLARILDENDLLGPASRMVDETGRATSTVRVQEIDTGLIDTASLSLTCSARNDNDCSDPTLYGVGTNACCSLRPTVRLEPADGEQNVCRNIAAIGFFSTKMDGRSLQDNAYLELLIGSEETCPAGHEVLELNSNGQQARGFFQSIKKLFSRVFGGNAVAAENGACVMPITSIEQTALEDGRYKVNFIYRGALEPNATYEFFIGEEASSRIGVRMATDRYTRFTTASDICAVTDVSVIDTSAVTPGYFFSSGETHPFKAFALTRRFGQLQEIQRVETKYEWEWRPWIEDSDTTIVSLQHEDKSANADVTSGSTSGKAHVAGGLEIKIDEFGIHTGQQQPVRIAGAKRVETIICDNPWPAYGPAGAYPFMDTPESTLAGVIGTGGANDTNWMYFATSYCRDAGSAGFADDLPSVSIISPSRTEQNVEDIGVLKEYILRVNDAAQSGDAIGIRVSKNQAYLSPRDWYESQGFTGSPAPTVVDGFEAVQDGRTIYVSAPNVDATGRAYTNIYVISYNEGATETTREIYAQLLANFSFLVNKSDAGFCSVNGQLTDSICSVDSDCSVGYCSNEKSQIRRDIKRINDLIGARAKINAAGVQNPTLEAGTTIRGLSSSAWNSWSQTLGQDVGILGLDPLNTYQGCGSGSLLGYSTETCINENTGNYVCPAGSFVYHYKASGANNYALYGQLESASTVWDQPINSSADQRGLIVLTGSATEGIGFLGESPICSGANAVFGASSSCGDGVVGPGEVCEIGQRGGGESCQIGGEIGTRNQICNSTCTGFVTDPGAVCVAPKCGNGFIDEGEQCDDGAENGQYGFCGRQCTFVTALSCGDGAVTPGSGEACDCSVDPTDLTLSGRTAGGNSCTVPNGRYDANPANSCAWDCSGPAGFCGDGIVQSYEQCDGNIDVWAGSLCSGGGTANGRACTTNNDCRGTDLSGNQVTGFCGGSQFDAPDIYEACPLARVCIAGAATEQGKKCTTDADCSTPGTADGDCSENVVQTTRTKTCEDNGAGGEDLCTWANGVGDSWIGVTCKGSFTCGNGVLDAGEQCDDGNDSNADSCTRECKLNVCGDGYLHQGVEACDAGNQNGQACTAAYGSSCTSCTVQCTTTSSTGAFCGNGVREGGEFCDGGDVQFRYVSDDGRLFPDVPNTTVNEQMCDPSDAGSTVEDGFNQDPYECRQVGMCNGGSENGSVCFLGMAQPQDGLTCEQGGGTCVYEQCGQSCGLTCPFNTSPQLLRLTTASSTQRRTTIDLNSYTNADGEIQPQNAGSLIIPACTVAENPILDVDYQFDRDITYVVFVTDLSGSMTTGNRIGLTKQALRQSVDTLTNELAGDVQISLVGYTGNRSTTTGTGVNKYRQFYDIATASEADEDDDLTTCYDAGDPTIDQTSRFCSWSDTVDLQVAIGGYEANGGTNTRDGMLAAMELLEQPGLERGRKIMVMLSDGVPSSGQNPDQPYDPAGNQNYSVVDEIRSREIEIYTVALTDDTDAGKDLTGDMIRWSSGDVSVWDSTFVEPNYGSSTYDEVWDNANFVYNGLNNQAGIDYAYDYFGTQSNISNMYRSIVESITSIGLTLTSGTTILGQTVQEGTNVSLQLPDSFRCLPDREQQLPIRINFDGVGQVRISNARFNMCLPN